MIAEVFLAFVRGVAVGLTGVATLALMVWLAGRNGGQR